MAGITFGFENNRGYTIQSNGSDIKTQDGINITTSEKGKAILESVGLSGENVKALVIEYASKGLLNSSSKLSDAEAVDLAMAYAIKNNKTNPIPNTISGEIVRMGMPIQAGGNPKPNVQINFADSCISIDANSLEQLVAKGYLIKTDESYELGNNVSPSDLAALIMAAQGKKSGDTTMAESSFPFLDIFSGNNFLSAEEVSQSLDIIKEKEPNTTPVLAKLTSTEEVLPYDKPKGPSSLDANTHPNTINVETIPEGKLVLSGKNKKRYSHVQLTKSEDIETLKAFQREHKLPAKGQLGPQTIKAMLKYLENNSPNKFYKINDKYTITLEYLKDNYLRAPNNKMRAEAARWIFGAYKEAMKTPIVVIPSNLPTVAPAQERAKAGVSIDTNTGEVSPITYYNPEENLQSQLDEIAKSNVPSEKQAEESSRSAKQESGFFGFFRTMTEAIADAFKPVPALEEAVTPTVSSQTPLTRAVENASVTPTPVEPVEKVVPTSPVSSQKQQAVAPALYPAVLNAIANNAPWIFPNDSTLQARMAELNRALPAAQQFIKAKVGNGKIGAEAVNKFLKENGFSIQLDVNSIQELDISAASIMKIRVQWEGKGIAEKLTTITGKEVDSVFLKDGVKSYTPANESSPVIQMSTKNDGITVNAFRFDGNLDGPMAIYDKAKSLQQGRNNATKHSAGAKFPMVDFSEMGVANNLLGAHQQGVLGAIQQALFQNKVQMDEFGAVAEAAVALSKSRSISFDKPLTIDGPFLLWFTDKDGNILFAVKIEEKDMKRPPKTN